QWAGGGVVFGPHPRSYTQALPRQMRILAIRSALSAKFHDDRMTVLQGLGDIEPKTKTMKAIIETLPESRSILIVIPDKSEIVDRAASNLPNVHTILASYVNVRDVLKYERLVVTPEAIAKIEALWALPEEKRTPSAFKQARLAAASAGAEKGA
ncbi:MAG TPA: 50S ribosomal protein L4, partial [bacterium]|nr:50S ribosomal protein L4 [bacterium]